MVITPVHPLPCLFARLKALNMRIRSNTDPIYFIMLELAIFLIIMYVVYSKLFKPGNYWKKKGIFHVVPWSNLRKALANRKSLFENIIINYEQYPERRYYGSYQFLRPSLFVRDLDLIKQITVKDFDHFPDHLNFVSEKADPVIGLNLFNLQGEKWKDMRSTLSPAFTSAKMRAMYTLMQDTAQDFVEYFLLNDFDIIELEIKSVFSRYTNDVIANCAFGIKCDSLKEENNMFFTMGTNITSPRGGNALRGIMAAFFPKFFEFFRIPIFPAGVTKFFRKLIVDTMSFREKENIVRPDMIHLLMEARKGQLRHENETIPENDTGFATAQESPLGTSSTKIEMTDDLITAQALVFFFAGFETTSTLLSFLSYELALNPDIQRRLQGEVDRTRKDKKRKVSYEQILKMKYLDQVVSETLRKYPPGFILNRVCSKDYKIPATKDDEKDFVLDKGCLVTIPVAGIHRDPQYFPDPDKFDPDRFSDENKGKIVPGSYMPFGNGPRNCIGSRFALLEAKVLMVSLMSRFDIVPVKRTQIPLKLAKSLNLYVRDGFWLGFKKRAK